MLTHTPLRSVPAVQLLLTIQLAYIVIIIVISLSLH